MNRSDSEPGGTGGRLTRTQFQSRSSPSLVTAATFNLRDFSIGRKKLPIDRPISATQLRYAQLEEIDNLGGNGRWRQRKAKAYFEQRDIDKEEARLEAEKKEAAKKKRRQLAEERRNKQLEEEERNRLKEQERSRVAQAERDRAALEAQEKDRIAKEEKRREWQRRQPTTCQTCEGSGICPVCNGKGEVFGLYLVPCVHAELKVNRGAREYGKLTQGCTECEGYRQGVRGAILKGSGKCPPCMGFGKIWPQFDESTALSPKSKRLMQSWESTEAAPPKVGVIEVVAEKAAA